MLILIRAVNERAKYVQYLRNNLPEAEFVFDVDRNAMNTFLAALSRAGDAACLHMEDDVILAKDFLPRVKATISEHSQEVIQFFSMRKADLTIGSRYDPGRNFIANLCFYLPETYSRLLYDYYPHWPRRQEHPTGSDLMIADFLKARREKYYIHVPSLVQHRQCKSAIDPRRSSKRQSLTFEGESDV